MHVTLCRSVLILGALAAGVIPAAAQRGWDPLGDSKKPAPTRAAAPPTRMIVRALSAGQPVTDLKAEEVTRFQMSRALRRHDRTGRSPRRLHLVGIIGAEGGLQR
jgi:hypothetical protein